MWTGTPERISAFRHYGVRSGAACAKPCPNHGTVSVVHGTQHLLPRRESCALFYRGSSRLTVLEGILTRDLVRSPTYRPAWLGTNG